MPITRKQFDFGVDARAREIVLAVYSFLKAHADAAFSERELVDVATAKLGGALEKREVPFALLKLVGNGYVQRKQVGGEDYYLLWLGRDLDI